MDNLTHSLAGLAVGELIQRTLAPEADPGRQSTRRRMLLVACWAANNFPDLDLVLKGRLPEPIGYLLDHRGHTHTLLYAVPQALLLMALIWLLWPGARRLLGASRRARWGLAAAAGIGLCMHIGFDFLNSYGVHPFYPFDARWFYGDVLFILEPVLWVAFGAPLIMMAGSRFLRTVFALLLAAIVALSTARDYLHWGSALALLLAGAALMALQLRTGGRSRRALVAGMAAAAAFVGLQAVLSAQGRQQVMAAIAQAAPKARVVDVAMTPFPANPACWSFVSVEREDASGLYRLRRGMLSTMPGAMPIAACPQGFSMPAVAGSAALGMAWTYEAPLASLRTLAGHCRGNAWLRFARMPALWPQGATDARFSPVEGSNFSTMPLENIAALSCPANIPQWAMPRADLLSPP